MIRKPKDKAPKDKAPKDKAPKDKAPKDKAPKDKAPKDEGSGRTVVSGADIVTIEDLSVVPPIRAHGSSVEQAEAAFEYQAELRSRHDAQSAPHVAVGIKSALPAEDSEADNSDLTPGRIR